MPCAWLQSAYRFRSFIALLVAFFSTWVLFLITRPESHVRVVDRPAELVRESEEETTRAPVSSSFFSRFLLDFLWSALLTSVECFQKFSNIAKFFKFRRKCCRFPRISHPWIADFYGIELFYYFPEISPDIFKKRTERFKKSSSVRQFFKNLVMKIKLN